MRSWDYLSVGTAHLLGFFRGQLALLPQEVEGALGDGGFRPIPRLLLQLVRVGGGSNVLALHHGGGRKGLRQNLAEKLGVKSSKEAEREEEEDCGGEIVRE